MGNLSLLGACGGRSDTTSTKARPITATPAAGDPLVNRLTAPTTVPVDLQWLGHTGPAQRALGRLMPAVADATSGIDTFQDMTTTFTATSSGPSVITRRLG